MAHEIPPSDDTIEVPEGAAVFPLIPEELGIHPLLLAVLHAVVFLDGSSDAVLHDAAADESLQYIATYLQRLQGPEQNRLREDMHVLAEYARSQDWSKEEQHFISTFLADYGIETQS